MHVEISTQRLFRILISTWVVLVVAGLGVEVWKYVFYLDDSREFLFFFGLSYEQNLPTWFSSGLLLLCAVQLTLIAVAKTKAQARYRWHWSALAAVFYYISLDEAATLHEDLSRLFDFGGVLHFGWVIPASIAVLVFGACYIPFLLHLPPRTRVQFFLAGCVYVGGALVVEMLLGYWTDRYGSKNLGYGLIDLVEESMEMLGLIVFFMALLEYLAGDEQKIVVTIGRPPQST